MIQRKQTLYLFFAGLIPLVLLFIPFADVSTNEITCKYNAFALHEVAPNNLLNLSTIWNAILLIATSVLSFITIFLYKRRKVQIKLISLNMLIILVAICAIMYIYPSFVFQKIPKLSGAKIDFNYTILISFISAIGLFFSKKAIMKDEALVRSADRLR
ncbi:MAG: DUF4293 domain-containing protein [Bacteroidales bacterium]|jgi:cation transport ATPase|nr:DUF4293 domain-containing protein [Bacteroidales bacterium]